MVSGVLSLVLVISSPSGFFVVLDGFKSDLKVEEDGVEVGWSLAWSDQEDEYGAGRISLCSSLSPPFFFALLVFVEQG